MWRLYVSEKESPPEAAVLSVKRATWPLFIPNFEVRSPVLRLRSSVRDLSDPSSLSAYCMRARSCRKTQELLSYGLVIFSRYIQEGKIYQNLLPLSHVQLTHIIYIHNLQCWYIIPPFLQQL